MCADFRCRYITVVTHFSGFHPSFQDTRGQPTPEGDLRRAFYLSYNDSYCEHLLPDEVEQRLEHGEQVVSTTYVTPYPPGFPVLVPGQAFSPQTLSYMRSLDTPEVHGYRPDLGYRVYVDKALEIAATTAAAAMSRPKAAARRLIPSWLALASLGEMDSLSDHPGRVGFPEDPGGELRARARSPSARATVNTAAVSRQTAPGPPASVCLVCA